MNEPMRLIQVELVPTFTEALGEMSLARARVRSLHSLRFADSETAVTVTIREDSKSGRL